MVEGIDDMCVEALMPTSCQGKRCEAQRFEVGTEATLLKAVSFERLHAL